MKPQLATLRRFTATSLSLFLTVGLGLIGPASAFADGVERGGLNFKIVSDDILKSANGAVPEVQANTSDSGSGGTTADAGTASASDPADGGTTADSGTDSTADTGTGDAGQTSAELNAKGDSNNSNGKKSGQR